MTAGGYIHNELISKNMAMLISLKCHAGLMGDKCQTTISTHAIKSWAINLD